MHLLAFLMIAAFLAGCATAPLVVDAAHPANPGGPAGRLLPLRTDLQPDAATLRTRTLLAQREEQSRQAAGEGHTGSAILSNPTKPIEHEEEHAHP